VIRKYWHVYRLCVCGNSSITEYQRLTYRFDPLDKPSDGYTEDTAYDLRLMAYDLWITTYGFETVF